MNKKSLTPTPSTLAESQFLECSTRCSGAAISGIPFLVANPLGDRKHLSAASVISNPRGIAIALSRVPAWCRQVPSMARMKYQQTTDPNLDFEAKSFPAPNPRRNSISSASSFSVCFSHPPRWEIHLKPIILTVGSTSPTRCPTNQIWSSNDRHSIRQ